MFGLKKKRPQITKNRSLVTLRPLKQSDASNVCRWMASWYIVQNSFVIKSHKAIPHDFATIEYAARYFDMLLTDKKRKTFAIMYSGAHIGTIGLKNINPLECSSECFIEIGEPNLRGQGLGPMAMALLLDMAFNDVGLTEVLLDVLEFNAPAIKAYHRLGFTTKASIDWHYDEYGQHWRVLKMGVNRERYNMLA